MQGIDTKLQQTLCDPAAGRWVFKATVYRSRCSKGFVVTGMQILQTYLSQFEGRRCVWPKHGLSIALCGKPTELAFVPWKSSVLPESRCFKRGNAHSEIRLPANGSNNGQPRLRDQLCFLIRQYNLDPNLVKAYAADFCGTEKLSDASRDQGRVVYHSASQSAKENRDSLICKLNSYGLRPRGDVMRRHIPGLHSWQPDDRNLLEGLFLVRVDRAFFRWQPKKPYLELRFVVLEPKASEKKILLWPFIHHRESTLEIQLVSPRFRL